MSAYRTTLLVLLALSLSSVMVFGDLSYSDQYVRLRLMPMAAAASANRTMLKRCLARTFDNNYTLIALVQTDCAVPPKPGKAHHLLSQQKEQCGAFLAAAHSQRALVLAFRSTRTFGQFVREVWTTLFRHRVPSPLGGRIGAYFAAIFTQLWHDAGMGAEVRKALAQFPNYEEIWITGHSLGGSLASLAVAELSAQPLAEAKRIRLVTMGEPKTGNKRWALALNGLPNVMDNYRIVHSRDPIPHLPPPPFRYRHHGTEVWYPTDEDASASVGPQSLFIVCTDTFAKAKNCSGQLKFEELRIEDHFFYFGRHLLLYGRDGCAH